MDKNAYLTNAGAKARARHMPQRTIALVFPRAIGEEFCFTRIKLTLHDINEGNMEDINTDQHLRICQTTDTRHYHEQHDNEPDSISRAWLKFTTWLVSNKATSRNQIQQRKCQIGQRPKDHAKIIEAGMMDVSQKRRKEHDLE